MALRLLTWLVSFVIHGGFALALLFPVSGGAALDEGAGTDIMVIEQGLALQGFIKLGEDFVSVQAIEAPPAQLAAAQPLPEKLKSVEEQEELPIAEVKEVMPIEEQQVLTSEVGPEQENVIEPQELEETKPEEVTAKRTVKEPAPEEQEQLLPPQVATVPVQTVIAMRESSGEEKKGGDATAHRAYLGKLRIHLEHSKVNPNTSRAGTAVVRLTVKSDGELIEYVIVKSSGSETLDNAALASIKKASPFPPIPSEVGRDTVVVSVPFKFSVR